jgi:hypothetical protein
MKVPVCCFNQLVKFKYLKGAFSDRLPIIPNRIYSFSKIAALVLAILLSGNTVLAQTKGSTQMAGANAGNPSTRRAIITEIVDFAGYNDSLAATVTGQAFEIEMRSGHILKFNLKRTGSTISAVPLLTNPKAAMGGVAFIPSSKTALPALYTTVKPCDATLLFDDIAVTNSDGTPAPTWNIIIIDSETTNTASETTTLITNGQNWTEWDLITKSMNNPIQSGIGTSTLKWTGTVSSTTGAYAAGSINPTIVSAVLRGARQGIALAIQSFEKDHQVETCSGSAVDVISSDLNQAPEITYTWSDPIISGRNGDQSLIGWTTQSTTVEKVSQTLINNTDSIAKAIYTITPHHQSGVDLAPFKLTALINPLPSASIEYGGPFCTQGHALVTQTGQTGGTYTSTNGLIIDSLTGEINLQGSNPGQYFITYTFRNSSCISTTQAEITLKALPKATITYSGPFCTIGTASVIHTGESGGIFSSTDGIIINSNTGDIDLLASKPGNYTITYSFGIGSCKNSTTAEVNINGIPNVTATASSTTICAGSSVTLKGGGADTYRWDNGVIDGVPFTPAATKRYKVTGTNINGCIDTATVIINVNPCPPVANPDEVTGVENLSISGTVAVNDSDPKGGDLTFVGLTVPANGSFTFKPDGSFTFLPDAHWNGTTSFEYQACNLLGFCAKSILTINVHPENDPPVAADDAYKTAEDTPLTLGVPGILINDSDVDHDSLTASLVTGPSHGIIHLNSNGSFLYLPEPSFHGTDILTYKVSDGSLQSNVATVTIVVSPVNDPPVAADDHLSFVTGKPFAGNVSLNDSDPDAEPLHFNIVSDPQHGKLIFNPDGSFTYIADDGFFGDDPFVYSTCDGSGSCREAKANLVVLPMAIVNLTPSLSRITEGNKVSVTAVLTQPIDEDVVITLEYNGDALNGKDYTLFGNFLTIRIPAGQTTTPEAVSIGTLIDNINEKDEHALISIRRVNANKVKIGTGADVVILDVYPMDKDISENILNAEIKPDPLFSPNSDEQGNENFRIGNIELFPDNKVLIFNRWGNEVFRINNYDNNERSFRGISNTGILTNVNKDLSEGVYYYLIYSKDAAKKQWLNKGFLILKR